MNSRKSKKAQYTETRALLVKTARKRFSKNGYLGTRFDDVAKDLEMTSGVLYHHFNNKTELFEEVVRLCHSEIRDQLVEQADAQLNAVNGLIAGCMAFINLVISKKYKQILLIDALSVLGWKKWKEIDDEYSEKSLREGLAEIAPAFPSISILSHARMISGATNELALWIADEPRPELAIKEAKKSLTVLIKSIHKDLTSFKEA